MPTLHISVTEIPTHQEEQCHVDKYMLSTDPAKRQPANHKSKQKFVSDRHYRFHKRKQ
jgi:hypothetical protein